MESAVAVMEAGQIARRAIGQRIYRIALRIIGRKRDTSPISGQNCVKGVVRATPERGEEGVEELGAELFFAVAGQEDLAVLVEVVDRRLTESGAAPMDVENVIERQEVKLARGWAAEESLPFGYKSAEPGSRLTS